MTCGRRRLVDKLEKRQATRPTGRQGPRQLRSAHLPHMGCTFPTANLDSQLRGTASARILERAPNTTHDQRPTPRPLSIAHSAAGALDATRARQTSPVQPALAAIGRACPQPADPASPTDCSCLPDVCACQKIAPSARERLPVPRRPRPTVSLLPAAAAAAACFTASLLHCHTRRPTPGGPSSRRIFVEPHSTPSSMGSVSR